MIYGKIILEETFVRKIVIIDDGHNINNKEL